MAYPDLYSDESVVLNAQNIKVKSVTFEAVLTTRRLILVDSKKHLIAPQEILLATLKDIEMGENAIRDSTITLSIITNTGATRQMILTFSKVSGGERRRECEEWVKQLRQNISSSVQHPIMADVAERPSVSPVAAEPAPPKREVTSTPAPAPKKKIEIARPGPIKKIVETAPTMPKPVETTTLPVGSFCNRCGNRVPPESVFCNKCGTPVTRESDNGLTPAPAASYSVPQVHMPAQPAFGGAADRKERPIEEVIHSIEPLIEDSVPRTQPAPIIPKQHAQPVAETPPAPESPEPASPEPVSPAPVSHELSSAAVPEVHWPVITPNAPLAEGEASAAESPAAEPPAAPPHFPVPPAVSRKPKILMAGILAVVIIAIVAAVFVFTNPLGGGLGITTPVPTPTPAVTVTVTAIPTTEETPVPEVTTVPEVPVATGTPQISIPGTGVWVHVIYANQYTGSVGLPGNQADISGSGERFFQVPTSEGIVVAAIQKSDGSSDKLTIEVYKNGEIVDQSSTVTPKGIAEIQVNLKPSPTPTPTPAPTAEPVTTITTAEATNATATTTP
ncbi:MAG: hypothetical protein PHT99_04000 [Methanoregula sp.]|nr:hypothetical protein [Methanoregula sp.]